MTTDEKLKTLEEKLTEAVKKKYKKAISARYVPDSAAYKLTCDHKPLTDTPSGIGIELAGNNYIYDYSTDFADIIKEYRAVISEITGKDLSKIPHMLINGHWDSFSDSTRHSAFFTFPE